MPSRFFEVMRCLQVHPEFGGDAKATGQAQRRVGGDRTLAMQDLGNPVGGDIDIARQCARRNGHRRHELFAQNLPRRYEREALPGRLDRQVDIAGVEVVAADQFTLLTGQGIDPSA